MRAIKVSDGIQWVGAIDWNLRDFHGFETPRGTTYNAYLVRAEKTALVDTVKAPFVPELLSRIASIMDPADVDYIVVNHVEPDHNGGLRDVMAAMPNAKVVASPSGVRGVAEYHDGLVVDPVKQGDVIDLGGRTLTFLPLPMVHWPDSMVTYCPEDRVLMSNDAFGQHLASAARFADEVGFDLAIEEVDTYYANILMPLGSQVSKAVEKVVEQGWALDTIAPSHGVIWRGAGVGVVLEAYGRLAANTTCPKAVIAYTTMWGSTDALARAIADGLAETGVHVRLFDLAATPFSQVTRQLMDSRCLLMGSPTLHHGMLYRNAGYLQYLAGLKPSGKIAGVFGSYGWSSGACAQMSGRLEEIGFELLGEPFTQKYRPTAEEIESARAWGASFAERIMQG